MNHAIKFLLLTAIFLILSAAHAENWVDTKHNILIDVDSIHRDADGLVYYNEKNWESNFDKPDGWGKSSKAAYDCEKRLDYSSYDIEYEKDWKSKGVKIKPESSMGNALMDFVCSRVNDALGYKYSGDAKQAKKNWDGAIADYTKAIELKPDYTDAYYERNYAKQYKEDWDGSIADCTKVIELKPDFANAYCDRGYAKKIKGDLENSIMDYDKAIELRPGSTRGYFERGEVKQAKGDMEGAKADYKKTLEIKPGHTEAQNALDELNKK